MTATATTNQPSRTRVYAPEHGPDLLRLALARLPDDEQVVLALAALPGRTYRAVARMLGEEPQVVLARLSRGMARLTSEVSRLSAEEVSGDVFPQRH